MKDLRQRIRDFRKERGLSYAEFSKRFFGGRVSPQTLKNLETGYVEPRISTLRVVSEKLGIDIHEIAHQAFGLDSPQEMGEINKLWKDILEIAGNLDERKLQLLLSFAKFLALEDQEELKLALNLRSSSKASSQESVAGERQEQQYIMELLEELEKEWKTTVEEENPFA